MKGLTLEAQLMHVFPRVINVTALSASDESRGIEKCTEYGMNGDGVLVPKA